MADMHSIAEKIIFQNPPQKMNEKRPILSASEIRLFMHNVTYDLQLWTQNVYIQLFQRNSSFYFKFLLSDHSVAR